MTYPNLSDLDDLNNIEHPKLLFTSIIIGIIIEISIFILI